MQRILVIGATGRIGREVVSQLVAEKALVRALARDPSKAALPTSAEVVAADLTKPESLDRALEGVEAVFLLWMAPADTVPAALERITMRARRVVFLSSPHNVQHPFVQRPQPNPMAALHREIERRISESSAQWTFLRPGMFASNTIGWWARQIRTGDIVRWPYAQSQSAPTDDRDIAAVAVRALRDQGHNQKEHVITGPESLTHAEQVALIGEAISRRLRYEEMPAEEFLRDSEGWPAGIKEMLLKAWQGGLEQPAYITSTVRDVTGKPARTFREWARDRASAFRG